jgi:dUTP pyrophosphatase
MINWKIMKTIQVKRLSDKAILPKRSYPNDAGLDLFASEDIFIPVGATVKIPTDIAVNIEPGYYAQISDRSSMGSNGLRTGAGIVDTGFTGNLCVVMHNLNYRKDEADRHTYGYQIKAGDKIAQLVVQPVSLPIVEEVNELPNTDRSNNGFGSSGR